MKPRKPLARWIINLFFIIGLMSAAAFRLLIVFKYISPYLFRPMWYAGVIGYLSFFLYRYMITEKRRHAISESDLIRKLSSGVEIDESDRKTLLYIVKSVMLSRENWNYLAIFIFSIIAIILDLFLSMKTGV